MGLAVGGMAFVLSATPQRWRLPAAAALAIAAIIAVSVAGSFLRFHAVETGQDYGHPIRLGMQCILFGLIFITFVQAWQSGDECDGAADRFPIAYEHLVGHAWRNSVSVAISCGLAGLFWLLLVLFGVLFDRAELSLTTDLFTDPMFAMSVSGGAFAVCLILVRQNGQIVVVTRNIAFGLFTFLVPAFLILSAGVLAILLLGKLLHMAYAVSASAALIGLVGLGLFAANTSAILIVLVGFGLIAVNAVIRDRKAKDPPSAFMRVSAMLLLPILLLFSGTAAYAIALRIGQYGLTPDRIFGALTIVVLSLWCLGFLACVPAGRRWAIYCRRVNIVMTLAVAGLVLALQTPLGDPYRLSGENQYRRLVNGVADAGKFDYGFLQRSLGAAGWEVLRRVADDSGEADPAVVAEHLKDLREPARSWAFRQSPDEIDWGARAAAALADAGRVRRVPATLAVPDDIGADTFHDHVARNIAGCGRSGRSECLISAIDLTGGPGSELLLAYKSSDQTLTLYLLERETDIGGWRVREVLDTMDRDALWAALLLGDIEPIPPDHRDIRIGDDTIRLYRP